MSQAAPSDSIQAANIRFREDGTPLATDYDDIYFSTADGLQESRYVFFEGNRLSQRWQGQASFCLAETGFGTGLNFLATWLAFTTAEKPPRELTYFSIEKHPLGPQQIRETIACWPELSPFCETLLAAYPPAVSGFHTLRFEAGRVKLVLAFADVDTALEQSQISADAWYLDGFSPQKNPAMWSAEVCQLIAANTAADGTLATFTAASQVRRNLINAGFEMSKRPGFGKKREMLVGKLKQASKNNLIPPWFSSAAADTHTRRACVIGAGIAGAQAAWHLAENGWQVDVLEQDSDFAQGASGNRMGALLPKLTTAPSLEERFYLCAWWYQLQQISALQGNGAEINFNPCGALQLASNPRERGKLDALINTARLPESVVQVVDAKSVEGISGIVSDYAGYFFPDAGALSPRSLVKALLQHTNINLRTNAQVTRIMPIDDRWEINTDQGKVETPVMIVAAGAEMTRFIAESAITPVRGQTSYGVPSTPVKTVIGHEGYVAPITTGGVIFGATFSRNDTNIELQRADTDDNIDQLQRYLPDLALTAAENSHAGVRASTPDRWPVVGPLPDGPAYRQQYGDLHMGRQYKHYPPAPYLKGGYVLGGFGSRGLTTAGYCAKQLVEEITGSTSCSEKAIRQAMHPARFLIRKLKRGERGKGS